MKFTPLPKLPEQTDRFEVQSLGLPVGFDQERLGINVDAIHKIMLWSQVAELSIATVDGEKSEPVIVPGNVNRDGSAAASHALTAQRIKLSHAKIDMPPEDAAMDTFVSPYRTAQAQVVLNGHNKEMLIQQKEQKWPRTSFEPAAQAWAINKGLRQGLRSLIQQRNSDSLSIFETTVTGVSAGLTFGLFEVAGMANPATLTGLAMGYAAASRIPNCKIPSSQVHPDFKRQWSLFYGVPFDRRMMAALHARRTLVKALS